MRKIKRNSRNRTARSVGPAQRGVVRASPTGPSQPDTMAAIPSIFSKHMDILVCPACAGNLTFSSAGFKCVECSKKYNCDGGIPLLFSPNAWDDSKDDVTDVIKSFYEENPFPNYEDFDSSSSLRAKAEKGIFAALFDDQIPYGAMVLEVGCGTGQLTNFLGMAWERVVSGSDMCLNSLRLGNRFKEDNRIENAAFLQ